MANDTANYYRRRAGEATAAADAASDDRIKGIHRELAALYLARAENAPMPPPAAI